MSFNDPDVRYTPALRHSFLTPFYDVSVRLFTREKRWRSRLIEVIDPEPDSRVLDIGCGTGSTAIRLKKEFPGCEVVGVDPDPEALRIARAKAKRQQVDVEWVQGFVDGDLVGALGKFSRIVSSLVLHQTPVSQKKTILSLARSMLLDRGRLCIADYGVQPNRAMKFLFRWIVQTIDGVSDTQPNADGFIQDYLNQLEFRSVRTECEFHTVTGAISIYVART